MTAEALTVPLLRKDVLHFLGYRRRSAPAPRTEQALEAALSEARQLIVPRGIRRIVPPECAATLGLPDGPGSSCLGLGLVTIGLELEKRVTELLARGEDTRALLLDAAGSAAVEESAEELERRIRGDLGDRGGGGDGEASPTPRFGARRVSPGYGSWPITAQRALFEMLPHDEIGVQLLPSCLMAPRKSVSFAVWLDVSERRAANAGAGAVEEGRPGRCATCDMTTCPYRDDADEPEGP